MAARLEAAFKGRNGPAFVAYVTAGYPSEADTVPALIAMQKAGVDVIEIGVPFSDPLADGGTIQIANQKALENGISLHHVLKYVKEARAAGVTVPIVLMGYYNPLLAYGEAVVTRDCAAAGVDGFIVVDLPPEHATSFISHCDTYGLGYVPLVAPTTDDTRFPIIAKAARGFIYCVSVTGVTGARTALPTDLTAFIGRVRAHVGTTPIAVGFGLSTREHVDAVGNLADGVVMGSAVIRALETGGVEGMSRFLESVVPSPGAVASPVKTA